MKSNESACMDERKPDDSLIWTAFRKLDELRNELRESIDRIDSKHNETEKHVAERLADLERMVIEKDAARKDDIAKLDKSILVEGFKVEKRVLTLDWKVVVLVGALMGFLGFVAKDLSFSDLIGGKQGSSQRRGRN
jgi:hypothetical protein